METAIVATACVSDTSTLTDQLKNLQFGEPSYYLLQRSDVITDWAIGTPDAVVIEEYTRGRLFGCNGEIRWQKTMEGYSLLWLSEEHLPDGFTALGKWEASAPQKLFLLGGGDTPPWRDTRIPRELNYPMEWCESPQVQVIQYRDLYSQTIQFTRYIAFINK